MRLKIHQRAHGQSDIMNEPLQIRPGPHMSTPTYILTIRETGEQRTIYPEHEAALFAAIERRTGLDEAFARATLHMTKIRHPDMIVTRYKAPK